MNKQNALHSILAETNGKLVYMEQSLQIFTEILGMSLKEADNMRKSYGKRLSKEIGKCQELIISKLGDNEFSHQLISLLDRQMGTVVSKTYINTLNCIKKASINEILNMANGELIYHTQAYLLLTYVAELNDEEAEETIQQYQTKEPIQLEKAKNKIHRLNLPEIEEKIITLMEIHAVKLKRQNPSLIPFELSL
jgi:hypothetical protein